MAGPLRKRGGANPLAVTKIGVFFWKREKMQNVLKRKNMQKYFVTFLQWYLLKTFLPTFYFFYFSFRTKVFLFHEKTYVLDYSASFGMHIEKFKKKS